MEIIEGTIFYNPERIQIINGEEIMAPSPFLPHQRISGELFAILRAYVKKNKLGEVFVAPLDVILEDGLNSLQPDVFFVSKEKYSILKEWVRGVPDLVIEIVSKNSVKLDTVIKKEVYEHYGVQECWIAFPGKALIEVFELIDGRYQLSGTYQGDQEVCSPLLKGLHFKASAIF
ncbi:Uma2 family endonuclease [Dyadobacter arcticus]|uniref:Uma2 family endonuclease n=1 Tax=Dyadobacter arcticus TaxID=1078754 RepID=A0ABX0UGF6_9BACT|nr:Uma2 family endonuclease [Dyadobacter arcticus]NIJ52081.1 Uma2 family endonuclease [Dyadobacter arcticus]